MRADGARAEAVAADYLERRGLRLLERNYRCRFGEIDLILTDGDTLVFVEVRLRAGSGFGGAGASITRAKQARLIKTARHYLGRRKDSPPCRFDAVLLADPQGRNLEWIRDAFGE
ncbi:MAG: YraN family protein [Betaproteobacteria bacterium]|nr:YraN family protein [Betaproteobacteria bacterium]